MSGGWSGHQGAVVSGARYSGTSIVDETGSEPKVAPLSAAGDPMTDPEVDVALARLMTELKTAGRYGDLEALLAPLRKHDPDRVRRAEMLVPSLLAEASREYMAGIRR